MGRPDKLEHWRELSHRITGCTACLLSATTIPVPGLGNPEARLMLIGMEPGDTEEREGRPFVGRTGQFLAQCFESLGYPWESIYRTNMVRCRPRIGPKGRNATEAERLACAPWTLDEVTLVDPDVIILMGTGTVDLAWPGFNVGQATGRVRAMYFAGRERVFVGSIHGAAVLRRRSEAPTLVAALRAAVAIAQIGGRK